MNPWVILAVVGLWGASVGGAFFYGEDVGVAKVKASQADVDKAVQATRDAAAQGAAEAIARIKVQHTTVKQEVQREIQTNTVYRDCRIPADGMRHLRDAATGDITQPAGGGQLPRASAPGG